MRSEPLDDQWERAFPPQERYVNLLSSKLAQLRETGRLPDAYEWEVFDLIQCKPLLDQLSEEAWEESGMSLLFPSKD